MKTANKTSKDLTCPNMTQDEPERVKVEDMQPVCVWCDHVLACDHCGTEQPYDDMSVLKAKLSVSEKRAEEAEAETLSLMMDAVELRNDLERAISERDSSQASLLRVVKACEAYLGWADDTICDDPELKVLRANLRTALSPHTEK